jgi:hypothetical protein
MRRFVLLVSQVMFVAGAAVAFAGLVFQLAASW